jgi:hypothetical protein
MTRQALASDALQLSRTILAAVPVRVRIASIVQAFLREASTREVSTHKALTRRAFIRRAFTRDDMNLSIGLQALISMEEAGTPGDIEGKTIEELRPFIKHNTLSKLRPIANAIGSRIFSLSMAGKRKIPLPVVEEAWNNYTAMLQRHALSGDNNVGQAIHYMANGFTMRIKDVLISRSRRQEIRDDPEFGDSVHHEHEPRPDDRALWNEIERKFKSNPLLLGPAGEPWAWIYIEGKAGGMTEEQIIAAWNDASHRSGGEGGMNRSRYLAWLNKNGERRSLMRNLAKQYLDDEVIERLKLAVDRGALGKVLLLPSERDLLQLLV